MHGFVAGWLHGLESGCDEQPGQNAPSNRQWIYVYRPAQDGRCAVLVQQHTQLRQEALQSGAVGAFDKHLRPFTVDNALRHHGHGGIALHLRGFGQ